MAVPPHPWKIAENFCPKKVQKRAKISVIWLKILVFCRKLGVPRGGGDALPGEMGHCVTPGTPSAHWEPCWYCPCQWMLVASSPSFFTWWLWAQVWREFWKSVLNSLEWTLVIWSLPQLWQGLLCRQLLEVQEHWSPPPTPGSIQGVSHFTPSSLIWAKINLTRSESLPACP